MTPHCHWLTNYVKQCIPITLADHTIIYSAEVGNVVFQYIIIGKEVKSIELTCVLYNPQLRGNLLSCLYLTHYNI
ncbi:hypothetical protein BDQ12DRAFT_606757 [Crucibulum laeve]|uniref:Retrovirus-related Pol polyprotein from transposon TNT 1-94-like beta-barrel domain-containing protein n=1 Tax=Crucibulum laeve TaxID=68775 RepID=A0A5C3M1E2_9AGAR|nr:hypothetical protein BDQ12DRAFT_606757 [Crucibulum laeve]